jgi:ABC-type transport system substrate-binding protein
MHAPYRRGITLALLTLLALAFLAPGTATHARGTSAIRPQKGGTVAIRDIFGTDCLDPLSPDAGASSMLIADSLISMDIQHHYRPDIALRWKASHGGKWITLTLRRGVRYSNGDRFNARSLHTEIAYALTQPNSLAPLTGSKVLGPYTIRLIYSQPLRTALDMLTTFSVVDVPAQRKEGANAACQRPIGTGAFKVRNVTPGMTTVTLVRNPYHTWDSPWQYNHGRPYLSSMVVRTVTDDTTAVSELLSGDLDISRVPPSEISRLKSNRQITLHTSTDDSILFLGFNHARTPFNKLAVRRAISEAIDRKALIKVAYSGYGSPATAMMPRIERYFDRSAGKALPAYKPGDARRILRANHVTGPFTLETYTIPVFAATAQFIQAELAKVGITVNLAVKDVGTAQDDMRTGRMDMFVDIFSGNDPYGQFFSGQVGKQGDVNFSFIRSRTLDRMILASRNTVNIKKATSELSAYQQFMNKNVVADPLFSRTLVGAVRNRVHGYRYLPGSNTLMWPAAPADLYVSK